MAKKDILLIGKLAGLAKICALKLLETDFSFTVLDTGEGYVTSLTNDLENKINDFIVYQDRLSYFELLKLINNHRLIMSFGASYGKLYFKYIYLHKLKNIPIIENHTGADIKEFALEKSVLASFYRYYLKNVDINFTTPEIESVRNVIKLKLKNSVIYRAFPYINTGLKNILLNKRINSKKIKIFHPSHLDWMESDYFEGRNTIKGNDKFLVAIKQLANNGYKNFEVTLLNRGPDKEIAFKFIKDNKLDNYFIIKEHLSRDELFKEMSNSHLLINSFGSGAIGGIAMEALSMGLPVMSHIGDIGKVFYYGNECPIINCFTTEEIYNQLEKILINPSILENISKKSYNWFSMNIDSKYILYPLKFYYSILTNDDKFEEDKFEEELNKRKKYKNFLYYTKR